MRFQNFFKWQYNARTHAFALTASLFVINCVNAYEYRVLWHEWMSSRRRQALP